MSTFSAGIHWVAFRAGWAATYSNKSVQNIQPFIPGKRTIRWALNAACCAFLFRHLTVIGSTISVFSTPPPAWNQFL